VRFDNRLPSFCREKIEKKGIAPPLSSARTVERSVFESMKKIEYAPCQACVVYAMNASHFLFFCCDQISDGTGLFNASLKIFQALVKEREDVLYGK